MTATTAKYVRVLWELKAPVEDLETAVQIYRESPELQRVLTDPSVYKEENMRWLTVFSREKSYRIL